MNLNWPRSAHRSSIAATSSSSPIERGISHAVQNRSVARRASRNDRRWSQHRAAHRRGTSPNWAPGAIGLPLERVARQLAVDASRAPRLPRPPRQIKLGYCWSCSAFSHSRFCADRSPREHSKHRHRASPQAIACVRRAGWLLLPCTVLCFRRRRPSSFSAWCGSFSRWLRLRWRRALLRKRFRHGVGVGFRSVSERDAGARRDEPAARLASARVAGSFRSQPRSSTICGVAPCPPSWRGGRRWCETARLRARCSPCLR
jgi:hypothetical protein